MEIKQDAKNTLPEELNIDKLKFLLRKKHVELKHLK